MLIPYGNGLLLGDTENNTLVEIIKHIYKDYEDIPDIYQVKDDCLEFMFDSGGSTVKYMGIVMSMHEAIDMMEDVLIFEGFIFRKDGERVNPLQLEMFPDLFDFERGDLLEE